MPNLPERSTYTVIVLKEGETEENANPLNSGSAYTIELPPRVPRSNSSSDGTPR